MKKETLLIAVVTLVAGLIIGLLVAKKTSTPGSAVPAGAPAGSTPIVNQQQKTQELKNILATDPANFQAWVALGNEYFDSNQYMDAIEAYDKALEIQPNSPDVLTDQGVMFRNLGWYDRAIANFIKANQIDPTHATSIYNLGIVYRYDLQDFAKAEQAWKKFLEISPTGPGSDRVRQDLEYLRTHPQGQK
ncbi:MAG: tetratricopeptide repeat protein [Desulfuromonadales bacterium]